MLTEIARNTTQELLEKNKPLIIAGPCAAESEEMVIQSALNALDRGIPVVRASLWKPRTRHPEGVFMGIGRQGIPWLVEVAKLGVIPATEVLMPEDAQAVIEAIEGELELLGRERLLLWLGSRNQNDIIQQEIGQVVKGKPWISLMIKNQMWEDKGHWLGIEEAVLRGGACEDQLLHCHRGFAPGRDGLRNYPNFDMAWSVKQETKRPMLIDPSHMGGSVEKVLLLSQQAAANTSDGQHFDGFIIEVHPNPSMAKTDQNQQLTWNQLDWTREKIENLRIKERGS